MYRVWQGIHGKLDRPWASRHLSTAERTSHLLLTEEIGWQNLTFPRRDAFELFQEQIRIMGFGGTCERATNRSVDGAGLLTLGPLPNAANPEPFKFLEPKMFECSSPEYTQDPTLDVLIHLCRFVAVV